MAPGRPGLIPFEVFQLLLVIIVQIRVAFVAFEVIAFLRTGDDAEIVEEIVLHILGEKVIPVLEIAAVLTVFKQDRAGYGAFEIVAAIVQEEAGYFEL
jgi:hypothetical protein